MELSDLLETARRFGLDDPSRVSAWQQRLAEDRSTEDLIAAASVPASQRPVDLSRLMPPSRLAEDAPVATLPVSGRLQGTVRDRVEESLAAIDRHRHLNAFTAVFGDAARREADELDRRRADGEDVGPLAGWTVAVKDLVDVRGYRTTGGSRALELPESAADAPSVARLRRAGAVVVGMANLHALAYGALSTSSDAGTVGNPSCPDAIAGGSSGGSAAAVAAGLVDLAVGTDTAGSIRIPAALCGVVGIKPTYGRVSTRGVHPLAPSLDHVGPLARCVSDAALAVRVMSEQPTSPRPAAAGQRRSLDGVRVGRPRGYFLDHLDPVVRKATERAYAAVVELGGRVDEVDLPTVHLSPGIQLATLSAEAFDVHAELLRRAGHLLPDDVRLRLEVAMFRPAPHYVRAQRLRALLLSEFEAAFEQVDVLAVPTVPILPPQHGTDRVEVEGASWTTQAALTRLTMPFNLVGYPALTLPWADGDHGSIGLQLAGRPHDEASLCEVAALLEGYETG